MEFSKIQGTGSGEEKRFFFEFQQQWTDLFGKCSWYDFTLIHIAGEFAPYSGRWELCLGLLGFNVQFTYLYDRSFNDEMRERMNEAKAQLRQQTESN